MKKLLIKAELVVLITIFLVGALTFSPDAIIEHLLFYGWLLFITYLNFHLINLLFCSFDSPNVIRVIPAKIVVTFLISFLSFSLAIFANFQNAVLMSWHLISQVTLACALGVAYYMIGLPVELAERENTSIDFKKEDALDCVRKVFENDETQVYKQQLIDALMYDLPHAEVLARSKEWQEVAKILKSSNETKRTDLADVLALVRRISS